MRRQCNQGIFAPPARSRTARHSPLIHHASCTAIGEAFPNLSFIHSKFCQGTTTTECTLDAVIRAWSPVDDHWSSRCMILRVGNSDSRPVDRAPRKPLYHSPALTQLPLVNWLMTSPRLCMPAPKELLRLTGFGLCSRFTTYEASNCTSTLHLHRRRSVAVCTQLECLLECLLSLPGYPGPDDFANDSTLLGPTTELTIPEGLRPNSLTSRNLGQIAFC
jgi:hypothetical protein